MLLGLVQINSVIDVGCGDGPYEDVLAQLAEAGTIRYTGVDPDAARVDGLRGRWPWAQLRVGDAESLGEDTAGQFDHVLVLRSWNHLRDPAVALARLIAALRSGGTLTIVDNIAFGLVRTREQAARGEGSDAGFEHYRNDGACDAQRLCDDLDVDLDLLESREVTASTGNQWLLRYRVS